MSEDTVTINAKVYKHTDKLGRLLKVGDCVVYPSYNRLGIGIIEKIMPVMVRLAPVSLGPRSMSKYPSDLVRVDGVDVTMYLLKNSK